MEKIHAGGWPSPAPSTELYRLVLHGGWRYCTSGNAEQCFLVQEVFIHQLSSVNLAVITAAASKQAGWLEA
jgi:hypothetical protein